MMLLKIFAVFFIVFFWWKITDANNHLASKSVIERKAFPMDNNTIKLTIMSDDLDSFKMRSDRKHLQIKVK